MKYSLYKETFEDGNLFKLYLKLQDSTVVSYKFKTIDHMFSNLPNATRWFGQLVYGEDDYYLYPIDQSGISVGEYEIIQAHEKFLKIKFTSGSLEGEWFLRNVTGGEVLFWKPKPEGFVCHMKSVEVINTDVPMENRITVDQAFSSEILIDGRDFSGPCISTGVATGIDRISTLFTLKFLKKLEKKLIKKMPELVVDVDHELLQVIGDKLPTQVEKDSVNTGKITKIKLKENDKIDYIWCKGQTDYPIQNHAGLSITMKTELVWDDNLNIWVADDADPIGISITDKIQPACKICWVE